MKGTAIAAFMLIVVGVVLTGAAFMLVHGDITKFNSLSEHYVEKSYTCTDDVDSISIDEVSGSVEFVSGDVDKVSVTYFDKEDESVYEIQESDGKLSIERKEERGFHFFLIDFSEHLMTVTVPRDFCGELDVRSTSGSIRMNDITGKIITAKVTSGSVKLEKVTSESDLTIQSTSGSISLTDVVAGGNVSAKLTSGGIRLDNLKADGDISLEAVSGSVKGTIAGKESDYRIHAGVTSGSCNLKDSDQGSKELNVKTTSGSIKVEFSE